ncbi:MAG: DUF503 domain-containing protein [Planctomycetia bacterium]|nr:DUF503 domain-containing protein [Planctomycetia bacterium]
MVVGVLEMKIVIPDAFSLKDKRRAVKSLKDRIRNKFNVSVAEVEYMDVHRQAMLGIAIVTNDQSYAGKVLEKVVDVVRQTPVVQLVDYHVEML